jgi:hypothetical protein
VPVHCCCLQAFDGINIADISASTLLDIVTYHICPFKRMYRLLVRPCYIALAVYPWLTELVSLVLLHVTYHIRPFKRMYRLLVRPGPATAWIWLRLFGPAESDVT